jgi:hypothetical protein
MWKEQRLLLEACLLWQQRICSNAGFSLKLDATKFASSSASYLAVVV